MDQKDTMDKDRAQCQLVLLPWLPSCPVSLLFLQDLYDPGVEKDKVAEMMAKAFN